MRARRRTVAIVGVIAIAIAACSDDSGDLGDALNTTTSTGSTTTATPGSTPAFDPEPLEWRACGGNRDCATLTVPLDYSAPAGATISLELARYTAHDPDRRIGSLLLNPGGPGASGVDYLSFGEPFDDAIHERFDVIGFDPRGVGASTPLRCGGDVVDQFLALDSDPDDDEEQVALDDAARAIAAACSEQDGAMLPHVGTANVVLDIDTIRRALGEETISYVGFSYGTLLGLRYLEAFPSHARAVVLDGVVDPSHDFREFLRGQTEAFERTIDEVFDACASSTPSCPSIGAADAYDELLDQVERRPLPAGRAEVGPSDLATAAIYVTYSPALWRGFYQALTDGLDGDGTGLWDLAEGYRSFGGFTSYVAVECVDSPHPMGADEYATFAAELEAISPRFGAAIANELLPCAYWPAPVAGDPGAVSAAGAPSVLVVGNTGDAATPFEQAERVADALTSAVLLTYEGEGHTSLGSSPCVDDAVTAYLIDLELPDPGTVCD